MIAYISNPNNSIRKLLQVINTFRDVTGEQIYSKKKIRGQIPFTIITSNNQYPVVFDNIL